MHHGIGRIRHPEIAARLWVIPPLLVTSDGDTPPPGVFSSVATESETHAVSKRVVCILLECCFVYSVVR